MKQHRHRNKFLGDLSRRQIVTAPAGNFENSKIISPETHLEKSCVPKICRPAHVDCQPSCPNNLSPRRFGGWACGPFLHVKRMDLKVMRRESFFGPRTSSVERNFSPVITLPRRPPPSALQSSRQPSPNQTPFFLFFALIRTAK